METDNGDGQWRLTMETDKEHRQRTQTKNTDEGYRQCNRAKRSTKWKVEIGEFENETEK